jgi:pimeloyl-ACP methyl ester carboxylesterase
MSPSHHFLRCQNFEIHYTEWGDPAAPVVICWHGLTRTGRDFDELAEALATRYRVICPDTPGRGLSQWSDSPLEHYIVPFYAQIALDLANQLGIEQFKWVGTSMGGLIGMVVAAMVPERVQQLVLNDVGPEVPVAAVERIRSYAGSQPSFNHVSELEAWLRQVYQPFGENTDTFWRRMAMTSARRTSAGKVTLHYDVRLVEPFNNYKGDVTLWPLWEQIICPTLVIRGKLSDLLSAEQVEQMLARKPEANAQAVSFAQVGHAPTLARPEQIEVVQEFLG